MLPRLYVNILGSFTTCNSRLKECLPFQPGVPDPPSMLNHLTLKKEEERKFLEQLLDTRKICDFKVPVQIKAELRRYQQVQKLIASYFWHIFSSPVVFLCHAHCVFCFPSSVTSVATEVLQI